MSDESPERRMRPRKSGLQDAMRAEKEAEALTEADLEQPSEPEVQMRAPMRDASRSVLREEDPRARAARRTQELLDHGQLPDEGPDEFYVDREEIPAGWDYEWKTRTVVNKEDPAYQVQLARSGWEPVPAGRHPHFMPKDSTSPLIERKGMILMERPLEITKRVKMRDQGRALNQVRQKEAQLAGAPDGQFERENKGNSLVKVGKSYEPMPIPND